MKWGCKGVILLLFAKNIIPFRGLKLHNEFLEGVNPIIQNYQRKR
jgi:hypothetical protein